VQVVLIISNKEDAPVLKVADSYGVNRMVFSRGIFYDGKTARNLLYKHKVDLVVLAGFLWMIPEDLVDHFRGKMINIHPALLPKYGGKGMYGMNVHRAVYQAGERTSGITIHWVNERYDEGAILFQASCQIEPEDQPQDIARKVQKLEHTYLPQLVEKLLI